MTKNNEEKAAKLLRNINDTLETMKFLVGLVEMQDSFSQPDLATIENCVDHLDLAQRSLEILYPEVYH